MAPHWGNSQSLISKNHLSGVSASCPTAFVCRSAGVQRWGARRRKEPIISDPYGFRRGREGGRRGLGLPRCLTTCLSTTRRRRASHKAALWNSSVQLRIRSLLFPCSSGSDLFVCESSADTIPAACSVKSRRRCGCACIWRVRVSWQNASISRFPLILPQPPQNCLAL